MEYILVYYTVHTVLVGLSWASRVSGHTHSRGRKNRTKFLGASSLRDGGAGGGRGLVPGDGAAGDGAGEPAPPAAGCLRAARRQPLVLPRPCRQPQALGGAHPVTIPHPPIHLP